MNIDSVRQSGFFIFLRRELSHMLSRDCIYPDNNDYASIAM